MSEERKRGFPLALLMGAVVVLLLLAGVVFLAERTGAPARTAQDPLPFGPKEQAYAQRIEFQDLKMYRAANFLNQEFTYLSGVTVNHGTRTIRQLQAEIEFRNFAGEVVLADPQRLIGPRAAPLGGGQRREFEVSWEQVPGDWNHQYPAVRVTGLLLED